MAGLFNLDHIGFSARCSPLCKSGRQAPVHFASFDKVNRRKNIHTLSEFSRNFKYERMCSNSRHLNIV